MVHEETPEAWFVRHGLPYFVPAEREAARSALRLRRTVPLALLVLLLGGTVGVLVAWAADERSAAPAITVALGLLAFLWYALTAVHARSMVVWAVTRTLGGLRFLLPMASRALPLLLVFVTFLFINAEAWEMSSELEPGVLWLTVSLLTGLAVVFLLVRLPEEVDRVDDAVDLAFLERTTRGTPFEQSLRELPEGVDATAYAEVTGFERWNLILVLLVVQVVQILLLMVTVFGFFVLFGSLVMTEGVQESFTGQGPGGIDHVPGLPNLSVELVQVSLFLAAFSGLYFTVAAVTDEAYRGQFFASVTTELERAVGARAVYLAVTNGSP